MSSAAQWPATVMAKRVTDRYAVVTLAAVAGAATARPGQFASVRIAGPDSALLLRRALWISEATAGGRHGGTLSVAVDVQEPGGAWLTTQPDSAKVDVIAPLGRPFSLPRDPVSCLLIGVASATAALIPLAEDLVERGSRVRLLLVGEAPPFGVLAARRFSSEIADLTGAAISAVALAEAMADNIDVVYSAGPADQIRLVAAAATQAGVPHQAAIDTPLVCGSRTCTLCALPIRGRDGITRMVRSCTEGPVFAADLVRWDDLGTVPGDCLGAAAEQP